MLRDAVSTAGRWLGDLGRAWLRPRGPSGSVRPLPPAQGPLYLPLDGVRVTDGVGHTLFEEYAAHRAEARGDEETGWVLLGIREAAQAVVLATLPAGAQRDASVSHVRFNSTAQAVGSRIVRQADRRLTILGVVHTHPGSLRHPSDGDYAGDSKWVRHLRGGEGIFGIGTADARPGNGALFAEQPRPHVQTMGELRLSWYSLRAGAAAYRPLPVALTIGPDLARPLHSVWTTIEAHAERLERLARQQTGVTFSVAEEDRGPALEVQVPLAEPGAAVRARVTEKEVRYYLVREGRLMEADCTDDRVDRGIYLLLAELAAQE
jgi:proteasome lid subunit RPN8/RPN11